MTAGDGPRVTKNAEAVDGLTGKGTLIGWGSLREADLSSTEPK